MDFHETLRRARDTPSVVQIMRGSFEEGHELGYVVAQSDALLLLLRISGQIRFDGFSVLRIADLTEVEAPHDHERFVEEALRRRGESVEEAPRVEITSFEAALRSAAKHFPLVSIHCEEIDPDVCHVGAVSSVDAQSVELLEIDPDAEWDETTTSYPLSEITRIDFGGDYEDALALVAGSPPL